MKKISTENVTYNNIKSHQKSGLYPLSRKHNFGTATGEGGGKLTPPAFLALRIQL